MARFIVKRAFLRPRLALTMLGLCCLRLRKNVPVLYAGVARVLRNRARAEPRAYVPVLYAGVAPLRFCPNNVMEIGLC